MDAAGHPVAATVYPETDDMGEHETQRYISELLRALVIHLFAQREHVAHVGAKQFFYFVPGDLTKTRAPDVYVIEGLPQAYPDQGVWKTWEGHPPAFALEVVSSKWRKDYDDAPPDYDAMGTQELILFDPGATLRSRKRVRWQVFRRVRGKLKRVVMSVADRIESRQLGCFVRLVSEHGNPRLRLATGRKGETLVPTDAEAEAERAEAEAERAEAAERLALTERIARETLAVRLETERLAREDAEAQTQRERAAREDAEAQTQRERSAREDAEAHARAEAKARAAAEARAARIEARLRELQARVKSPSRAKTNQKR